MWMMGVCKPSSLSMPCPTCASEETQEIEGETICVGCGLVLDNCTLVSDVEFVDTATGGSAALGTLVTRDYGPHDSMRSHLHGVSHTPCEAAILECRRRVVQAMGNAQLGLQQHHADAANRLLSIAVHLHFTKGRRLRDVVAAALYAACRQARTPHMLLDFADAFSTSIYVLGGVFMRFCRLVGLRPPLVDPSLYIDRFAAALELGEKQVTRHVATTALRLVARMNRDWLVTGRSPSGICAAGKALFIACRIHHVPQPRQRIVHVLRVCGMTLRRRLRDIRKSPAARIRPSQLGEDGQVDLETLDDGASLPPSFVVAREKEGHGVQVAADTFPPPLTVVKDVSLPPTRRDLTPGGNLDSPSVETGLDEYILTPISSQLKSDLWHEVNSEYLADQERRERGNEKKVAPPRRRRVREKEEIGESPSAAEAVLHGLRRQRRRKRTKEHTTAAVGRLFGTADESDERTV